MFVVKENLLNLFSDLEKWNMLLLDIIKKKEKEKKGGPWSYTVWMQPVVLIFRSREKKLFATICLRVAADRVIKRHREGYVYDKREC